MGHDGFRTMTRRSMLKAAAASVLYLTLPAITGCSSVPKYPSVRADEGNALELIHCHLVDVIRGVVNPDQTITIRNGVIESISGPLPRSRGKSLVMDMKHRYIIPGLIDAHCHSTLSSEAEFDPFGVFTTLRQNKRNYAQQLLHGVTTIRDMGALPKLLHEYIAMIEEGELSGPRVVYCNAFTNVRGGHPDIDPADVSLFSGMAMMFTGNPSLWFKDLADLEKKMKQNSGNGASFIKLTMDSQSLMCGKGAIPAYTDEHLKIIIKFSDNHNLSVSGHIHTKFGFDRALQFGLHSMEHSIADALLTDREVSEMAGKHIAIVPTMVIAQMLAAEEAYDEIPREYRNDFIDNELAIRRRYLGSLPVDDVEPAIHNKNVDALRHYKEYGCGHLYENGKFLARPDLYFRILLNGPRNLMKMKEAGVVIGCGTDAGIPYVYHGTLWREMEMLGRIGFTNQEVLRCATLHNAKILRMEDKIGTVEIGKAADLAVLEKNPFTTIEACRKPCLVVKGGQVYDTSARLPI